VTRTIRLLSVLVATAAAPSACSSCHASSSGNIGAADAQPAPAAEVPVAPPDGLVADAYLSSPNDFWKKLQGGVGGAASLLPDSFPGVICALAGLDPSLVREFDANAPAFAALGDGETTPPFAAAIKLKDEAHVEELLLGGDAAGFDAKDVAGMRMLVAHGKLSSLSVALARSGYLVVASSEAELERFGPYVVRTMPTRSKPASSLEISVPRAALVGPLPRRATRAWDGAKDWLLARDAEERANHGGRAPDYADASGIVECVGAFVERRTAILRDLDSALLDVDALDDGISVEASLRPAAGGGAASKRFAAMRTGDTSPLLDTPNDALLAWLFRDDTSERASDSAEIADCIGGALGSRIGADDTKRLHVAFDGWAKGRGDWVSASLRVAGGAGVVFRAPTMDAAAMTVSLEAFDALAQRPIVAGPLAKVFFAAHPTTTTVAAPPLGLATVVSFTRGAPEGAKLPPSVKVPTMAPVGAAWAVGATETDVAVGESPVARLVAGASPGAKLDARAAKALAALGSNVVFSLVARSTANGSSPGAPLVVGWGARNGGGWARVELGYPLARDFVRSAVGL
jgi:hypothetical protein